MASTSKDVGHISKFDGTNFPSWKYGIWMFLEKNRLIPVVDGSETQPTEVRSCLCPSRFYIWLCLSAWRDSIHHNGDVYEVVNPPLTVTYTNFFFFSQSTTTNGEVYEPVNPPLTVTYTNVFNPPQLTVMCNLLVCYSADDHTTPTCKNTLQTQLKALLWNLTDSKCRRSDWQCSSDRHMEAKRCGCKDIHILHYQNWATNIPSRLLHSPRDVDENSNGVCGGRSWERASHYGTFFWAQIQTRSIRNVIRRLGWTDSQSASRSQLSSIWSTSNG